MANKKSDERLGAEALLGLLWNDDEADAAKIKAFLRLPASRQNRILSRLALAGQYDPAWKVSLDVVMAVIQAITQD